MNTRSPEVQFEINFTKDLNGIFTDHKDSPDLKLIKDRLATSVVKEYNDYFKNLGVEGVVFVYDENTGKIIAPNLADITEHKDEIIKGLRGMGIIKGVKKEDVTQIIENSEKFTKKWEDEINKMIDVDGNTIFNRLKDKPSERIVQRQIDELNAAYAAKRNEYLVAIAQILIAVALIVTVAALVYMAIIPIATISAIPSTVIFALYEFKNISQGLNNGLEREKAYEAWQKAKEDKGTLINNISDDKVKDYLKAHTALIGRDAKIDETFEKVMLGIKRQKELHTSPPHKATAPQQPVVKKHVYTHEVKTGHVELAGEKFRKNVKEALVGITADTSGRAKKDIIKDALKNIFVEAHNEYFESIGLNDFKLIIDGRTKSVSLGNFDKDALDEAITNLDMNPKFKDKLVKSFDELEKQLENLDTTLDEYASELTNAMNASPKDTKKLDKPIDDLVKEMDGFRSKLHASYIKIALAILLVIGMGVATFTGVIPMVAFTGAICTSTLFIAGAMDSIFENKSKISDLQIKIDSSKKADLEKGATTLGMSENAFDNLKIGKHDTSDINKAVLKFVSQYQPEIPGPARTA